MDPVRILWTCVRIGGLAALLALAAYGVLHLPIFPSAKIQVLPELEEVRPTGAAPKPEAIKRGAVVFVHGLTGDRQSTWSYSPGKHKKAVTWMSLIANDKSLNDFDIFTFGYGSSIFIDKTRVEDAVTTLRTKLDEDLRDYYHVILIAHSLGGLIARSALLNSAIRDRNGQVVTLFTCATPFNGSELANILRMLTNHESEQVDILTTANELQDVDGRLWDQLRRDLKPRLAHYAAFEMRPISLFKKPAAIVVRKDSAVLRDCEGQKGIEANHIDIVKPDSVHAPIYAWVAEIIAEREHKLITFPQLPGEAKVGVDKHYLIGPGTISVDRDIRIPATATFQIRPETTLKFEKGAILESEGRLEVGLDSLPGKGVRFDFAAAASSKEGGVLLRGLLTEGSSFKRCEFHGGSGISIVKPHPERHTSIDWARDAIREPGGRTSGGAVALVGARGVRFEDCSFIANRAWTGGAVAVYGSERLRFARCRFEGNLSGFGGGAAFVQEGEIYFQDVHFSRTQQVRSSIQAPQMLGTQAAALSISASTPMRNCTAATSSKTSLRMWAGHAIFWTRIITARRPRSSR